SYLDTVQRVLSGAVASSLGILPDELDPLLAGAVLSPDQAKNHGWVTRISTYEQLVEEQRLNKVRSRLVRGSYARGRGRRIAVLFLEGAIADGQSRRSPLTGQTIGAESYVPYIRRLRDDRSVAAVVLRINSGGGSATASEDLYDEIRRLSEKKPVAVSLGGVAASGGYWIACAGAKIFAEQATLTGSIGVFSLSFHAENLMRRHDIGWSVIRRGESADRGSLFRSPTQNEEAQMEAEVDRIYEEFLDRVATARSKDRAQVHAIGQGRVWSGSDALDLGLVDRIGGIREAAQELASELRLKRYKLSFYPRVRYSLLERLLYSRLSSAQLSVDLDSSILSLLADSPAAITHEISLQCGPVMALAPEALTQAP
ncbi:MAG TPA: signal peptide peptidase SppA, partial [Spirochaetia bacterium]|nr:signal peptide peptidase SppA [Spirochaetia bacterium]